MNLEVKSEENLAHIINEMARIMQVVNGAIMDPADYSIDHYDELKSLHDLLQQKGKLTVAETQAFIAELKEYRK
ncbi:DUF1128 family protein [Gracilibacillus sp. S3-1-1]|uniref:DUF1128 family protein n=1 Tax=Gracilibacillus pellucidus TaxID=3095368 RepID=A0ACC6M2B1_9BACI|nr:DUF1128 family protein [Gracilibacillus sp. S3-1-1]MDX8045023.1 DUF1128 family protein [Gracilibacillus sp. S3-1-1]